jgi:hypothetical protein
MTEQAATIVMELGRSMKANCALLVTCPQLGFEAWYAKNA